jgi:hypothetical protein
MGRIWVAKLGKPKYSAEHYTHCKTKQMLENLTAVLGI